MWILDTKFWSSARASALQHWATSPDQVTLLHTCLNVTCSNHASVSKEFPLWNKRYHLVLTLQTLILLLLWFHTLPRSVDCLPPVSSVDSSLEHCCFLPDWNIPSSQTVMLYVFILTLLGSLLSVPWVELNSFWWYLFLYQWISHLIFVQWTPLVREYAHQ